MAKRRLTSEHVGRIRALLDMNFSFSMIQRELLKRGDTVSKGTLSLIKNGKYGQRSSSSSKKRGPEPAASQAALRRLESLVDCANPMSQRDMAVKLKCSPSLVRKNLKRIGWRKVTKPKGHGLTAAAIEKRRQRSRRLWLILNGDKYKKVITSDESLFHLHNSRGETKIQYLPKHKKRCEAERQQVVRHSKSVMVWVAFDWNGFYQPIFVDPGAKVNRVYYVEKILRPFAKEYKKRNPNHDYLFQQDSAPSHAAKSTLEFLKEQRIPFISPEEWMPNSPDCAPCDYWLWNQIKRKLAKKCIDTIPLLKRAITREVKKIDIEMMREALKSWPKRVYRVYKNQGGYIED